MSSKDARFLSPDAQEVLRSRVMAALRGGMTPAVAARTFAVSRSSVWNWRKRVALGNITSLRSKKRGRPKGTQLAPHEAATTVRLVTDRCPDQLKLPFALWTRAAVQQLLAERFDVQVSVRTVGRYLALWGLTPQKPLRRAYDRDPVAVKHWLEEQYPAIERQAKAEKAEIHWGDQMGLRSDHQTGTSYARRGQTPVIPGTGQRFRCNMMSTITNRGHLSFMVFKERFTAAVCIRFLRRLTRQADRKVILIVDRHPVHRSRAVQRWLAANARKITLFFLPGYSPDLNPDEFLNRDVKSNALGRRRPATRSDMIKGIRAYLRSTQCQPEIVKSYFHAEPVRYAAA
ncbi:MAG: IS630 family transposase [Phycisphaerae bacterium]